MRIPNWKPNKASNQLPAREYGCAFLTEIQMKQTSEMSVNATVVRLPCG